MSKLSTIVKLEMRFKELRIEIIKNLQKIKREAESPPPFVKIVSNEDKGGQSALVLDALGKWNSRFGATGCPIDNPSVNNLLEEYALIADAAYRSATIKGAKPEARKSYLNASRLPLLRGLVQVMEKSLQDLSKEV